MDEVTAVKMNFRKEQWKQLILERQASGLSINNWCKQHGFKRTTCFYWLRRIRQEACQTLPDSQAIAPVPFVQIGAETVPNTVSNPLTESKVQMSSKILHRGGAANSSYHPHVTAVSVGFYADKKMQWSRQFRVE